MWTGLVGLILATCLIAWFSGVKLQSASSTEAIIDKPGPWGKLDFVRINIELPDHFIDVENIDTNGWFFKGESEEQAIDTARRCGMTAPQLEMLRKAHSEFHDDGWHVFPSDDLITALSTGVRSKLYGLLANFEENTDQFYAFSYQPDSLPDLLKYSDLREETIDRFKALLYPQGQILRFADTDVILRHLTDRHERLRFVKTVARRSTLLVKLNITPETDIDALVNYWGTGGRAKDLRPLLESLARVPGGCRIDIAHLLPPFARQRIYTYPTPDDENVRQDCHWTSLNFFNNTKLQNFANPEEAAQAIMSDYSSVGTDLKQARFGDIVFFKTSDNTLIHSAVYIAADILFTKNGAGLNQPWIYMKLPEVLSSYALPDDTLRVEIFRRNKL